MTRLRLSIPVSTLAEHKHKIAVSALSTAAVTGAVLGAVMGSAPTANASAGAGAVPAKPAAQALGYSVAAPSLPPAPAAPATPTAAPPTAAPVQAPVTQPPPAPAKPAVVTQKALAASNQYSGLSPYQVAERMVPSGQFGCFDWVVTHESGWSVTATNPSSGAYGLGQALPGSKMASAGSDWRSSAATQIKWTLGYMDSRYGSPCSAQSFWQSHHWY